MRKSTAAAVSLAWGLALGGTFGCLLPYLLGEWHFHQPLPYWAVAQAAGGLLICAGLVPIVQAFAEFIKADGTPVPAAPPPRLVVSGFYRYVRNPIYVGFMAILSGEALLFGSPGLLGVHRCGLVDQRGRCPVLRGTNPGPQIRGRVPGLPARRACLGSPAPSMDARSAGRT